MTNTATALTDERLSEIEERNQERREFRRHLPSGPYFYDSLGYVHNELALRSTPTSKLKRAGVLVRSHDWFQPIDMDARLTRADRDVGADLGQYLALVCDRDVEQDVADLVDEVRRLRARIRE
jgi:hypothetical protein